MKHVVCYSGGHSSAIVAIEVCRKFGKENVILLNHDINPSVEDKDIKRFKNQVAQYLDLPITFANMVGYENKDQLDVAVESKGFKFSSGTAICTTKLKTKPFKVWLDTHFPVSSGQVRSDVVVYYGFDANELHRVQRRIPILLDMGYKSDYPLALWTKRTIQSTKEIGIEPPLTYGVWKHANCTGCLKAGRQHWYLVFLHRKDLWEKAKAAEDEIGFSIIKGVYLDELEEDFIRLEAAGLTTSEHEDGRTFAARARKLIKLVEVSDEDFKPCECTF